MKIVNRGFITITPKKPFIDWANEFENDIFFDENDELEPTLYLIEDDFIENEQIILANFKQIFKNELSMITEDEKDHPEITEKKFNEWFTITIGTTTIDLLKSDIKKLDL